MEMVFKPQFFTDKPVDNNTKNFAGPDTEDPLDDLEFETPENTRPVQCMGPVR
jgi:hypothetical protein